LSEDAQLFEVFTDVIEREAQFGDISFAREKVATKRFPSGKKL
jgi:hypothetical protein